MTCKGLIIGTIILSKKENKISEAEIATYFSPIINMISHITSLKFEIENANKISIFVENPADILLAGILLRSAIKANIQETTKVFKDINVSLYVNIKANQSDTDNPSASSIRPIFIKPSDIIKKTSIRVCTPWESINEEFYASIPFLADVIDGWTPGQAKAIFYSFLNNCKKKDLAHIMGQTSQNTSRLLLLAKEKEVRNLVLRFQSVISSKTSQMKEVN